jgi:NAD(P)-dependent dehydrogenase (short-subunit alcohol dehydrogenase family)
VADKIALVTGAAAGLGRAIALRLSEEGAALVLADIDESGLAETEATTRAA